VRDLVRLPRTLPYTSSASPPSPPSSPAPATGQSPHRRSHPPPASGPHPTLEASIHDVRVAGGCPRPIRHLRSKRIPPTSQHPQRGSIGGSAPCPASAGMGNPGATHQHPSHPPRQTPYAANHCQYPACPARTRGGSGGRRPSPPQTGPHRRRAADASIPTASLPVPFVPKSVPFVPFCVPRASLFGALRYEHSSGDTATGRCPDPAAARDR